MSPITVAELLNRARLAHLEYRESLPRMASGNGHVVALPGDPIAAQDALDRAYALRAQAEALDQPGTDPAWVEDSETHPHYALLSYYAEEDDKARRRAGQRTRLQTAPQVSDTEATK